MLCCFTYNNDFSTYVFQIPETGLEHAFERVFYLYVQFIFVLKYYISPPHTSNHWRSFGVSAVVLFVEKHDGLQHGWKEASEELEVDNWLKGKGD